MLIRPKREPIGEIGAVLAYISVFGLFAVVGCALPSNEEPGHQQESTHQTAISRADGSADPASWPGFPNINNSCWFNATIKVLLMDPRFPKLMAAEHDLLFKPDVNKVRKALLHLYTYIVVEHGKEHDRVRQDLIAVANSLAAMTSGASPDDEFKSILKSSGDARELLTKLLSRLLDPLSRSTLANEVAFQTFSIRDDKARPVISRSHRAAYMTAFELTHVLRNLQDVLNLHTVSVPRPTELFVKRPEPVGVVWESISGVEKRSKDRRFAIEDEIVLSYYGLDDRGQMIGDAETVKYRPMAIQVAWAGHQVAYLRSTATNRWVLHDDQTVRVLESGSLTLPPGPNIGGAMLEPIKAP